MLTHPTKELDRSAKLCFVMPAPFPPALAEPLRGSDERGKATWNDGLGETALR